MMARPMWLMFWNAYSQSGRTARFFSISQRIGMQMKNGSQLRATRLICRSALPAAKAIYTFSVVPLPSRQGHYGEGVDGFRGGQRAPADEPRRTQLAAVLHLHSDPLADREEPRSPA